MTKSYRTRYSDIKNTKNILLLPFRGKWGLRSEEEGRIGVEAEGVGGCGKVETVAVGIKQRAMFGAQVAEEVSASLVTTLASFQRTYVGFVVFRALWLRDLGEQVGVVAVLAGHVHLEVAFVPIKETTA